MLLQRAGYLDVSPGAAEQARGGNPSSRWRNQGVPHTSFYGHMGPTDEKHLGLQHYQRGLVGSELWNLEGATKNVQRDHRSKCKARGI